MNRKIFLLLTLIGFLTLWFFMLPQLAEAADIQRCNPECIEGQQLCTDTDGNFVYISCCTDANGNTTTCNTTKTCTNDPGICGPANHYSYQACGPGAECVNEDPEGCGRVCVSTTCDGLRAGEVCSSTEKRCPDGRVCATGYSYCSYDGQSDASCSDYVFAQDTCGTMCNAPPPSPPPPDCTPDCSGSGSICSGLTYNAPNCGQCVGTKNCSSTTTPVCGDGLCSKGSETSSNCSQDCGQPPGPACTVCGGANQACCYGSDAYCGGRDGSRCVSGSTCILGRCQETGGGGSCIAAGGSCLTDSSCCGGDCWVGGGSICRSGGGGGSCSNPRTCVPGDPSKQCCSGFFCNTSREPFECTSTAGSCVSPPDRCGPAADGRGCCPGSYCFEGPCRERDGQGNCLDRDYNCVCQPKCPDPSTIACGQAMSDGCGGDCDGAKGSKCLQGNCDFTRNKCLLPWIQVEGDVHSNTRIDTPGGP